jgi:hypothetical protein
MAAVLTQVVQVDEARVGRRVPHVRGQQAPLGVEAERLVRREHRRRDQLRGAHWAGGVRHVEHEHARELFGPLYRERRKQQRGVVDGALVARGIDVAEDLEPAAGAVMAHGLGVARVALRGAAASDVGVAHPSLHSGLRTRTGPASRFGRRSGIGPRGGMHGTRASQRDQRC